MRGEPLVSREAHRAARTVLTEPTEQAQHDPASRPGPLSSTGHPADRWDLQWLNGTQQIPPRGHKDSLPSHLSESDAAAK